MVVVREFFVCVWRGPTYRRAAFGPRNRAGRRVGRESVCRTRSTPSRRHLCISSRTHESSHSSLPFHLRAFAMQLAPRAIFFVKTQK